MIAVVAPGSAGPIIEAAEAEGIAAWTLGSVGPGSGVMYA
jgi:hypothetical protein